jgi:predicted small integral membrane protein
VLHIVTTRGDRLFISLLGAAFIHLAWLAFVDGPLRGAGLVAVAFAVLVFRYV